ncbi:hypothetical protein AAU61_08860 [Desulfocarbo indianensis]|nr:hypothetical protein AAU61_08860 [Desulfocarbo indianensis]
MPESMDIKILVLEHDETMRHWLGRLLTQCEGYNYLGSFPGVAEASQAIGLLNPHIILLDTACAVSLSAEEVARLKKCLPLAWVLLLDLEEGPGYERLAQRLGADGFLCKGRLPEQLRDLRQRFQQERKAGDQARRDMLQTEIS